MFADLCRQLNYIENLQLKKLFQTLFAWLIKLYNIWTKFGFYILAPKSVG